MTDLGAAGPSDSGRRALAPRLRLLWTSGTVGGQAVRFAAVGAFNTLFSFGIFAAVQRGLEGRIHYVVALVIAHLAGILEAYVLQRWLVYQVRGRWCPELIRFSSVYLVVLAVNLVLLPLLVEVWHMPVIPTQGVIMVLVAVGTFLTGRYFTFRRSAAMNDGSAGAAVPLTTEGHER